MDAGTAGQGGAIDEEPSWTEARSSAWTWSERAQGRGRFAGGPPGGAQAPQFTPGDVRRPPSRPAGPEGSFAAERLAAAPGRTGVEGFGTFVNLGEIAGLIRHAPASPRVRIALALAAWPPLGLALALAIGEATGCARFAAACTSSANFSTTVLLAQVGILGGLAVLTPLARVAAFGSLAVLLAALPVVAFLTAAGATYDPEPGSAALLTLLGLAWAAGIVVGIAGRRTMRAGGRGR
jgi:hypothetical protein